MYVIHWTSANALLRNNVGHPSSFFLKQLLAACKCQSCIGLEFGQVDCKTCDNSLTSVLDEYFFEADKGITWIKENIVILK
jgi:hypothetical protein